MTVRTLWTFLSILAAGAFHVSESALADCTEMRSLNREAYEAQVVATEAAFQEMALNFDQVGARFNEAVQYWVDHDVATYLDISLNTSPSNPSYRLHAYTDGDKIWVCSYGSESPEWHVCTHMRADAVRAKTLIQGYSCTTRAFREQVSYRMAKAINDLFKGPKLPRELTAEEKDFVKALYSIDVDTIRTQ